MFFSRNFQTSAAEHGADALGREQTRLVDKVGQGARQRSRAQCTRVLGGLLVAPSAAMYSTTLVLFYRESGKRLVGCCRYPFGDGCGSAGAAGALRAPASPPVSVRKSFSGLKISSWCLESACGSVCLICNLNLIARASSPLLEPVLPCWSQLPSPAGDQAVCKAVLQHAPGLVQVRSSLSHHPPLGSYQAELTHGALSCFNSSPTALP